MNQKHHLTETELPKHTDNISVPIGLMKVAEYYLGSIGILDFLDTLKTRGISLHKIVLSMCTQILMGNNSMNKCSEWLGDPYVRKEFGLESGLTQRTINRAMNLLGDNGDRILVKLWEGLNHQFHFDNTDVNIDGSAVVVNGPEAKLGAIGHPRDYKDMSRNQVEFTVAELQSSRIPFFMRAYKGNTSDAEQYRDAFPDIFDMIRKGSWIIVDNGGASGDILDSIVRSGNKYITRTKFNASDDKRIREKASQWEYVEDGVCCLKHTFDSSGRTTYLFWSFENWSRSYQTNKRNFRRMVEAITYYNKGHIKKSDFVTVKKNILADVEVKISVQTHFEFDESEEENIIQQMMGSRAGIFKLESSEQLTPSEALNKYRARATVEHLIHSLKRVTGIKPLRVWTESSIRGSMILALLSELVIAMARYEMKGNEKTIEENGRKRTVVEKPNTESIVWSLSHLTLTRIIRKGCRKKAIYSNWDTISKEIFDNMRSDPTQKEVVAA